jgi:hypothetical protein
MHGWHPAASAHGSHGKGARCAIKKGIISTLFFQSCARVSFHFARRRTLDLIAERVNN